MPRVTVNGKEIEVEHGTSVIEAADMLGIHIPRFCYHPDLTVDGNCRMCLVEVEGVDKLLPSCALPVTYNMVVRTDTERVRKAVKGVLEFLLVHHPIDCPICDQSGECYLQDYYVDHALYKSRFPLKRKIHKVKAKDIGGDIMLDAERCVLCTRCIRFLREVAGTDEMNIFARGAHSSIGIYPGKQLDNMYTCNLADICPVGALTSKDFRFQCRVWYLKETKTICTGCATGCNLLAHHHEGKVYRLKPRYNKEVNGAWMCDIGRFSYKKANRGRITTPLLRSGDGKELKAVNWETALFSVKERVNEVKRETGPSSIALLPSPKSSNEELYLWQKLAFEVIGTPHLDFSRETPLDGYSDDILVRKDRNPNSTGALKIGITPGDGGQDFPGILSGARSGSIRLIIISGPHLGSMSESETEGILENIPIVINISSNVGALSKNSTILLPSASFIEREGTYTNYNGRVQRFFRGIESPCEVMEEVKILSAVASALGAGWDYSGAESVFREMAGKIPFYRDLNYETLGEEGIPGTLVR